MRIVEFDDYKQYLSQLISHRPKKGRGELTKLAAVLRVNPSFLSQVLSGERNLLLEQACDVADYFGLSKFEKNFFVSLVELSRAGSVKLRSHLSERLDYLKSRAEEVESRSPATRELSESERSLFYSYWYYSAVRLLVSIPGYQNTEKIAERLGLPLEKVERVVESLERLNLLARDPAHPKKLKRTTQSTFVGPDSMLRARHHENWRQRCIENLATLTPEELAFSYPVSLSKVDFKKLKNLVLDFIEQASAVADPSPPEELACLNIDLFWI